MKTIHQLQAAELQRCLQHKIGEQFRAMYAEEGCREPSGRLLDLLRDFERIEIGEFAEYSMAGGYPMPFAGRRS
jgi:hypothetical protein